MTARSRDWLGKVPDHWTIQPAISVADVCVSTVDKKVHDGEMPVQLCNYTDVYYGDRITDSSTFMRATASAEQVVRFAAKAGDVPVTKDSETSDDIGISAFVERDLPGVVYGYHLAIYRPEDYWTGRFIKYLFDSSYIKAILETQTLGVTRVGLSQKTLHYMKWPVPPLYERRAIAEFLDYETGEIDVFITDQERLIELLTERRSATIAHTLHQLTLRDHVAALKHLASVQTGVTLGSSYDEETHTYPYLRVANVQAGYLDTETVKEVEVPVRIAERTSLRAGDVLMTEGGDRDKLGRGAMWDARISPCLHQNHVFAIRCDTERLLPQFLVYALDAPPAREYFNLTAKQTTNLASTNSTIVRNTQLPVPSIDTQYRTVDSLDRVLSYLDAAIADAREAIALSRERRAALISAAVTGKIDVRDWKRPKAG